MKTIRSIQIDLPLKNICKPLTAPSQKCLAAGEAIGPG
jgi:hypothetical protein